MVNTTYKIGDTVTIKSSFDIGRTIDSKGRVGDLPFRVAMNCYCGTVMTIDQIDDINGHYRMKEDPWHLYNDAMIERKFQAPKFKVGDRVHTDDNLFGRVYAFWKDKDEGCYMYDVSFGHVDAGVYKESELKLRCIEPDTTAEPEFSNNEIPPILKEKFISLEDACKWLRKWCYQDCLGVSPIVRLKVGFSSVEEMIEEFRKDMKE